MLEHGSILNTRSTLFPVGICAIVTMIIAFYTVITISLFEKLRSKFLMKIVSFISLQDLLSSAAYFLNMTNPDTCGLQGFVQNYCYLCAVLWASVLTFVVDRLLRYGKIEMSQTVLYICHAVCWVYPLLVSLLPLASGMQYVYKDEKFRYNCKLVSKDDNNDDSNQIIWIDVFYSGAILICIVYMYILGLFIVYKLYNNKTLNRDILKAVVGNLFLYPAAMVVAWIPYIGYLYFVELLGFIRKAPQWAVIMCDCLTVLNGAFTGLVFMYTSKDGLMCWKRLLFHKDKTVITDNFDSKFIATSQTGLMSQQFSNFEDYYVDEYSSGFHRSESTGRADSTDSADVAETAPGPVGGINIEVLDSNMKKKSDISDELDLKNRNKSRSDYDANRDSKNPLYNTLL